MATNNDTFDADVGHALEVWADGEHPRAVVARIRALADEVREIQHRHVGRRITFQTERLGGQAAVCPARQIVAVEDPVVLADVVHRPRLEADRGIRSGVFQTEIEGAGC